MKALRFHNALDLRIDEVDAPKDPASGEVRVRVLRCGICGSDLHEYCGGPRIVPVEPHPLTGASVPQILGHEFSGAVEAVGKGVTSVQPGDRVAIIPHINKPGEYFSRRNLGHFSSETAAVGFSYPWGGMAEVAMLPEQNVVRLPPEVSDDHGALFEPLAVALNAIDVGQVFPGSTVLVTGAGPIGALTAMAAVAAGATRVLVFEPNAGRRHRLASLPGMEVFGESAEDLLAVARHRADGGVGVDIAFECAGNEAALALCIDAVLRGGVVVQVGVFTKPAKVDMARIGIAAISIRGSSGFPITIGARVVALLASGKLPVDAIITGRVSLGDAVEKGFKELARPGNEHVKILIDLTAK